jgi:feruloyl esterase
VKRPPRSGRRFRAALGAIGAAVFATTVMQPSRAATSCAALTALTIPQVRVTSAADVQEGSLSVAAGAPPLKVPAFCRVAAVATPTPDSHINFEVWLPPVDVWNGKFQAVGNSGWTGALAYDAMAAAIQRGYATASTDTGHTGDDLSFAAGHPERLVDWAYRAVHVMTVASKLIVRARQGRLPQQSYFAGCSTGGAQGLMAAQRYPDDYDGIVAASPGNDRVTRLASYLWTWNAAHQTPESRLSPEKLLTVNQAVLGACDAQDGVKDGVIDDPRRCSFDPGTLLCRNEENGTCLTSRQLEALRKIYNGPHHPRQVRQIFPGLPKGSETSGWQPFFIEPAEPPGLGFWRHVVFSDPGWDPQTFDWDRDLAFARARVGTLVDATNPDLRAFKARGGRIIMTAGWNDPVHAPEDAIWYYEGTERQMGGDDKTKDFFRLFMVPGMGHCAPASAAPALNTADAMTALEMWTEHQVAPERIVISRPASGETPARSRLLCPYPLVARWRGSGSSEDAANFACASPPRGK